MRENGIFRWLTLFLSGVVLLFIIAPLAGMFLHTPLSSIFNTATEKEVQSSIWLTLWVAFTGTLIFSLGAIPVAWILARKQFRGKNIVQAVIDLPVVLPHTAAGIALLGFISRDGFAGKMARYIWKLGMEAVGHIIITRLDIGRSSCHLAYNGWW